MNLLCKFGFHRWVHRWTDYDSVLIVCIRCGKIDRPESRPTGRRPQ